MAQHNLRELHKYVTGQIIDQRTQEADQLRAQQQEAASTEDQRFKEETDRLRTLGIDTDKLHELNRQRIPDLERQARESEARMAEDARQRPLVSESEFLVRSNVLPDGVHALTPVWTAAFSSNDEQNMLVDASSIEAQDLLSGGAIQNYWNQAWGGGWGCTGGVGEIQSWVYFGFWFTPNVSRFWSVVPLFRFRGFHIVKADDSWYDCKSARVAVSAWTNVWQNDLWGNWSSVTVNSIGGDNINVSPRFDADRAPYSSFLLGRGDPAFVSCVIGLYARAQGGGSFAKNDFSIGNANYLHVPHCWVY